jgi:hypothetical protein
VPSASSPTEKRLFQVSLSAAQLRKFLSLVRKIGSQRLVELSVLEHPHAQREAIAASPDLCEIVGLLRKRQAESPIFSLDAPDCLLQTANLVATASETREGTPQQPDFVLKGADVAP